MQHTEAKLIYDVQHFLNGISLVARDEFLYVVSSMLIVFIDANNEK